VNAIPPGCSRAERGNETMVAALSGTRKHVSGSTVAIDAPSVHRSGNHSAEQRFLKPRLTRGAGYLVVAAKGKRKVRGFVQDPSILAFLSTSFPFRRTDARRYEATLQTRRDATARLSSELQRKRKQWGERKKRERETRARETGESRRKYFDESPRIRDVLSRENSGAPLRRCTGVLCGNLSREKRAREREQRARASLIPGATPTEAGNAIIRDARERIRLF